MSDHDPYSDFVLISSADRRSVDGISAAKERGTATPAGVKATRAGDPGLALLRMTTVGTICGRGTESRAPSRA